MAERHATILAELSELGLVLARDLQARALAAKDQAVADLGLAFHRVSRSVRQSLALEARLARERAAGEREAGERAAREGVRRLMQRRAQVRAAVARAVWDEAEGEDEAEVLLSELDERLAEEALADDFTAEALDAHVARIRADLGLAARRADLPFPSPSDPGAGAEAEAPGLAPPYEYDAAYEGDPGAPRAPPPARDGPGAEVLTPQIPAWARAGGPPGRQGLA